MDRTPEAEN